ncbi:MAG TPA: type III-B CRISPR module RAMP protein Cmr4 [Candidatus Desulfofervidus auxilii]|uniref:Type III-B CRISPR module RAMP protein Cmr4 n=1 Tax=Desulfofervidus auxilii TaxID=1621989 RepID=A0A7V0IAL3_DESA2|nr:type III-B CRISPR module RAMP protein Cmr4 [Candidatus Desulfofervidus auxilii]
MEWNSQKINVNEIPPNSFPKDTSQVLISGRVILEEYTFELTPSEDLKQFANWLAKKTGIEEIPQKIVVLSNNDFKDFVHLSTEVVTRIKINNATGTVETGALFTEEFLPAETLLYSLALASPIFKEKSEEKGIFNQPGKDEAELVLEFFKAGMPKVMQIGGDATIGKGIVRIEVWED